MTVPDELIEELAGLCGIVPEYWDIFGKRHEAAVEGKIALLKAMGLATYSEEEVCREIAERKKRPWNLFLEPALVVSVNDCPVSIPIYLPLESGGEKDVSLSLTVIDEQGNEDALALTGDVLTIAEERVLEDIRYVRINLKDRDVRAMGYYTLTVTAERKQGAFPGGRSLIAKTCRLIITPGACYIPPALETGRTWGLSMNLYSIRSAENWGIGDFGDLRKIVRRIGLLRGGFVGINPLHAIPNTMPFGISPYSPISRLYRNLVYLDMDNIPGFAQCDEAHALTSHTHDTGKPDMIDYERVAALKKEVLKLVFADFLHEHCNGQSELGREFSSYCKNEGETLESYAAYCALWEHMQAERNACSWQEWPEEYHDCTGPAVADFKKQHASEILFHQYIQWLIDRQLRQIQAEAEALGMPVGIYHDLAVGSIGGGSDAWSFRGVISTAADVGAPPDDFNPAGQNWGFPPVDPEKLRETGYEFFIQTIRKNMRHGGALRIDHALGLFRIFWIPQGMKASFGAYVNFPSEDLLRIIALESVRNKTMVIGEDLGTVGDNVRETLRRFNLLSYKLLYFERYYPDPSFRKPEDYAETALCTVTTHDLPTLYGYWAGRDIELKKRLGIYQDDAAVDNDVSSRERDRKLLLAVLAAEGIIERSDAAAKDKVSKIRDILRGVHHPDDFTVMTPDLCLSVYEYLARTPCRLLAVSLDDAIGTPDQQNMPGVTEGYPSWRRKTPLSLKHILSDTWFERLADMFKRNNRA
jgi:4-alpha-glucanotransferase